jgi:hypothetical protein
VAESWVPLDTLKEYFSANWIATSVADGELLIVPRSVTVVPIYRWLSFRILQGLGYRRMRTGPWVEVESLTRGGLSDLDQTIGSRRRSSQRCE